MLGRKGALRVYGSGWRVIVKALGHKTLGLGLVLSRVLERVPFRGSRMTVRLGFRAFSPGSAFIRDLHGINANDSLRLLGLSVAG